MEVIKCDCGNYAYIDDIEESVSTGIKVCPMCSRYCPNCSGIIGENEVLHNNKCTNCDEDY